MTVHIAPQTGNDSVIPVKVMIVDDSAFMRFAITQQLNEHPEIQVIGTASNGKEALNLIPELQPDVITLDIEMPQMTGDELVENIRKEANYKSVPVIMLSSHGDDETIVKLLKLGGYAPLWKKVTAP